MNHSRALRVLATLALALFLALPSVAAEPAGGSPAGAVKGFFGAVAAKDYLKAWGLLSDTSKTTICEMIAKDENMKASDVRTLFDTNDPRIQNGFWDSFRQSSKSDVLAGSTYTSGAVNGTKASVTMEGNTTVFHTFKENGRWKFGLMETFPPGN